VLRGPAEDLGQQQDLVPLEPGHVDVGEVVGELRVAEDPVVEAVDGLADGRCPAEPLVVARGRGDAVGPIPSHGVLLRTRVRMTSLRSGQTTPRRDVTAPTWVLHQTRSVTVCPGRWHRAPIRGRRARPVTRGGSG